MKKFLFTKMMQRAIAGANNYFGGGFVKVRNTIVVAMLVLSSSVSLVRVASADTNTGAVDPCLRKGLAAILSKVSEIGLKFDVTDVYYNDEGDNEGGPVVLAAITEGSDASQKTVLGEADMDRDCSTAYSVDLQSE